MFPTVLVFILMHVVGASADAMQLSYNECGRGEVIGIQSNYCTTDPCRIAIGDSVDLYITFIPAFSTEHVSLTLFTTIYGFQVTIFTFNDFCGYAGLQCPLVAHQIHTLRYVAHVPSLMIPVKGTIGFKMSHRDNATDETRPGACASIYGIIGHPPATRDEL